VCRRVIERKEQLARKAALAETTLDDLTWAQEALGRPAPVRQRTRLSEVLMALMHWQRHHDLLLEDKAPITAGEFDTEIEG